MGAVVSIFDPPPVDDPALGNRVCACSRLYILMEIHDVFCKLFRCLSRQDRPYFEYFGMTKFDVAPLLQQYNKMSKTKEKKVRVKTIIRRYGVRNAFMNKFFSMMVSRRICFLILLFLKTCIFV